MVESSLVIMSFCAGAAQGPTLDLCSSTPASCLSGEIRMNDPRRQTVETVSNALIAWEEATTTSTLNSEAAVRAGGYAMRLLFRNIAVLRKCAREFGADPVTLSILGSHVDLERLPDEELEDRGGWGWYTHICVGSFIGDLQRWRDAIAKGIGPKQDHPLEDFRKLKRLGKEWHFTPHQAAVIKVLVEAEENDEGALSGAMILNRAKLDTDRLVDVFKLTRKGKRIKHKAWGRLVISPAKGMYTLADQ